MTNTFPATDIAFALGIMALLGSRAPLSLKVLLTAIAVIDDLGAIIIIALFYTDDLSVLSLVLSAVGMVVLIVLNRTGVKKIAPYILTGIFLWVCVLQSGVHATLAGVITGLAIPLKKGDDGQRHETPVLVRQLAEPVEGAGRTGEDRFAIHVTEDVGGELGGRVVAPGPVLLQGLHDDPVEISADRPGQRRRVGVAAPGDIDERVPHRAEADGRPWRLDFLEDSLHLLERRRP